MGTVKYTGPVASFHCPTNAEIRSLKVHFSPKQLGEGDPSPENVREIRGWGGVEVEQSGKNLLDESLMKNATYNKWGWNNILKPNTTYTWSVFGESTFRYGLQLGSSYEAAPQPNKRLITYIAPGNSGQFTTPSDMSEYPYIYIVGNGSGAGLITTVKFKLELGSTATPYEPYHGSITNYEFGVLGKNKFDKSLCIDDCRIGKTDGRNYGEAGYYISPFIPVSVGASYTKNSPIVDAYHRFATYSEANTNSFIRILDNSNTITIEEGEKFLRFCGILSEKDTAQLELGSTATAYEPYDPNKTVYGGWVDLVSGEVCEEWTKEKVSSVITGKNTYGSYWVFSSKSGVGVSESGAAIAEAYISYDGMMPLSQIGNRMPDLSIAMRSINGNIFIKDTRYEEYDDFISNMGETMLCYKLSTPNIYSLAPIQLQTFLAQNNVWSNADYVEVEYDLHETQTILARKQFIVANQPHIVSPAAAPLQNFVTDMAAPLKECKVYFNPVQDLHGYDKPWVGGGGKNLFDPNCDMWNYSVYTKNNDQITQSGSDGRGWADSNIIPISLKAGTYTLTCSDDNNFNIHTSIDNYEANISLSNGGGTFTLSEDCDVKIKHSVKSGNSYPTTFTVQLEEGSAATAYEPYENICPIEGWNGIEVYKTKKSLVEFAEKRGPSKTYINGNASWRSEKFKIPDRTLQYTYSAFIDNRNATEASCVRIWFRNEDDSAYVGIVSGTNIPPGEQGYSYLVFGNNPNRYYAILGLSLIVGGIATQGMLELGDTSSEYELYNGTTIPITFPATTNLFNEQWEQGNIEVGNNASSSTCMRTGFIDVNPSTSYYLYTSRENNVFVFEYLEDGTYANKVNSVHTSHVFTTDSTTKKIRIVDRNSGTETVNTSINYPSTATYYEPYGTIYGGYVDLVTGEVWKEWYLYRLPRLTNSNCTIASQQYIKSDSVDLFVYPATDVRQYPSEGATLITYSPMCNRLDFKPKGIWGNVGYPNCWTLNAGQVHFNISNDLLGITDYTQETTTTAKAKIIDYMNSMYDAGNYFEFAYKIRPTLLTTLTPTQLKALRGTNNIWSNTNGNIELKYWTH